MYLLLSYLLMLFILTGLKWFDYNGVLLILCSLYLESPLNFGIKKITISSNKFLSNPSDIPAIFNYGCLKLSHSTLMLLIFSILFLLCFKMDNSYQYMLKPADLFFIIILCNTNLTQYICHLKQC